MILIIVGFGLWRLIDSWDWISTDFWDWLRAGPDGVESGSTTIRNLGLVFAGAVALLLAAWRSGVAQRQANTGQRKLSNQLYKQGAEMLQSPDLSVRLDGIYTLQRLAKDEPARYHVQVMSRLCAFVRRPVESDDPEDGDACEANQGIDNSCIREDVQAAMTVISSCHARHLGVEKDAEIRLDLRGADLACVQLIGANLSSANLHNANLSNAIMVSSDLSGARLVRAHLSNADLTKADLTCTSLIRAKLPGAYLSDAILVNARLNNAKLSGADLVGSDFSGANLSRAKLSGAELSPETRLTQGQLNQAQADPDNPPLLNGAVDSQTGKSLIWRGKPLAGQR